MGLALASGGSVMELAGTGSVRHEGRFWQLLTEATPVATLLPKPCHTTPIKNVTRSKGYEFGGWLVDLFLKNLSQM